jgi:hypothetical protein
VLVKKKISRPPKPLTINKNNESENIKSLAHPQIISKSHKNRDTINKSSENLSIHEFMKNWQKKMAPAHHNGCKSRDEDSILEMLNNNNDIKNSEIELAK